MTNGRNDESGLLQWLSRWPATAAMALFIAVVNRLPAPALPPGPSIPHIDKVVHFAFYFPLGALFFRSLRHKIPDKLLPTIIIAGSLGTLFAALDEWSQRFVDRTPDVLDFYANVLGLACGIIFIIAWQRRRKRLDGKQ